VKSKKVKQIPLPMDTLHFPPDAVLCGWLQPPPPSDKKQQQELKPVLIQLDQLSYYSMDRSSEYRGYWVPTNNDDNDDDNNNNNGALYWLQEPQAGTLPNELHFPARAVLALVTLLVEHVFGNWRRNLHVDMTVDLVLRERPLLPGVSSSTERSLTKRIVLEKRVLAKYQKTVALHLAGYLPGRLENDKSCTFLHSLKRLHTDGYHRITEPELWPWVVNIEREYHQHPWGGPMGEESAFVEAAHMAEFPATKDRHGNVPPVAVPEFVESSAATSGMQIMLQDNDNKSGAEETADETSLEDTSDRTEDAKGDKKRGAEEEVEDISDKRVRLMEQSKGRAYFSALEGGRGMVRRFIR